MKVTINDAIRIRLSYVILSCLQSTTAGLNLTLLYNDLIKGSSLHCTDRDNNLRYIKYILSSTNNFLTSVIKSYFMWRPFS